MNENTKLLSILTLVLVILGFGFLWFGFKPQPVPQKTPQVSTYSAALGIEGEHAFVTEVVDGDTIHVLIGMEQKTIRLLGIDTPETKDPRKPVQCFGKEASNKTKELLEGKEIILQKDVSETDKYGRLLRFIYLPLPDGKILFIDDYLIREGYAHVLTIPPDVKHSDQFLEAQREARDNRKGLWGRC